jgi:GAF domain-containing protein
MGAGKMPTKSLLSLLLDELPLDEFERELRIRNQVADVRQCRSTEDAVQIAEARALRKLLDGYQRRSAELAALYDTAGDLSSLRDIEMVLEAIVRRARQLLGTDVAYLMLTDERRGDTYMRVTSGTVTSSFATIRLDLGIGLGGVVAETGLPHWTANYLEDERYLHAIDAIVEDERLLAILGVPLKIGANVTGVLFAADRRPRPFEQAEISLLLFLAAHAAIAIENASRFQETRSSLAKLTEAMSTIEWQNHELQRAADMHERLMELVLAGGSHLDIARTVADVLGGTLFVLDADTGVLATSGQPVEAPWSALQPGSHASVVGPPGLSELLESAAESRRSAVANIEGLNCHVAPVLAGDFAFGSLLLVDASLSGASSRSLERAATVTALLSLNQRTRDDVENRLRGGLLAELLSVSSPDVDALTRRASLIGVDLAASLSVVVVVPADSSDLARTEAAAVVFAKSVHGLATTQAGRIVLLLPGGAPEDLAVSVAHFLTGRQLEATVGADGPIATLDEIAVREGQATRCAKTLGVLGRTGEGATAKQLGPYGLLLSEASQPQVRSFVELTLGPVERYDADRNSALTETMERYFDADCNVAQAAQSLFVHPNTLYQRLDRLDKILGADWRAGERAVEMRLALRLRRLSGG